MIKTEFGDFDGDRWEEICQICFQIKYENDGYQEMVAHSNGDLGIEGFTRTGTVFQCYCPDVEYNANDLYEKQRDKINTDLNKLLLNQKELKKYLGNVKIKRWYFITPYYLKKDIVKYCVNKAEEMRSFKLDILDYDFDVLINNINFISKELPYAFNMRNIKINVNLDKPINGEDIDNFRKTDVQGIDNLIRKSNVLISRETVRNKYIEKQIKYYLIGKKKIDILDTNFKALYESILSIMSSFQNEVEDTCMLDSEQNSGVNIMNELGQKLEERLKSQLGESVDMSLIDTIKRYAVSDWLIRCPFEIEVEEF